MHIFGLLVFSCVAALWIFLAFRVVCSAFQLPWIKETSPAEGSSCPSVSLILAARDEQEKLPGALATLTAVDYPKLEIITVNDRSQDSTGQILGAFETTHPNAHVVNVAQLPQGWLGKPHALYRGYERSSAEWLLFTDADVKFESTVVRRAMSIALERKLDHLTLLADVEMHGFWEKTLLTFFALVFYLANDPGRVNSARSRAYLGVGAFQLLRRSVYEQIGTHRRLAMEVVDDMKLGKLVKLAGFSSGVAVAGEFVRVRWQSGARNIIRGVTKNFFAAFGYNLAFAVTAVLGTILMNLLPVVAVFTAHGWIRLLAAITIAVALALHAGVDVASRTSPLYALTYPLGALLFCYMILRSVVVTLWRDGVTWRGTFYPLDELKRGVV